MTSSKRCQPLEIVTLPPQPHPSSNGHTASTYQDVSKMNKYNNERAFIKI